MKYLITFIFIVISSIASADYYVRVLDIAHNETKETKRILHIWGDFNEGIADDVRKALSTYKVDEAVLYSPGGLGYEGYRTGSVLSEYEVPVRVARGTYCISACAIAYLGGTDYKNDNGVLAFHKAWVMEDAWDSQNKAFQDGQTAGSYHAYYIVANGFSFELDNIIQSKTDEHKFLVFNTTEELNEYFVRTDKNNLNDYLEFKDQEVKIWEAEDFVKHITDIPNDMKWTAVDVVLELKKVVDTK